MFTPLTPGFVALAVARERFSESLDLRAGLIRSGHDNPPLTLTSDYRVAVGRWLAWAEATKGDRR